MESNWSLVSSLIITTDWVETPLEDLESYFEVEVEDDDEE